MSLSGTPLRSRGTTVQSRRFWSAKSRVALAFCSGLSEARNLFAASAIAAAERIRATPSTTDQVTSATATTQDNRITASFKVFIFGLRVIFGIQVLRFETRPIYAGQKSKSILPSESISLIVSAVGQTVSLPMTSQATCYGSLDNLIVRPTYSEVSFMPVATCDKK